MLYNMNSISIIIPIYNAEKTLDKCIKYILKQIFKNFKKNNFKRVIQKIL